MDKDDSLEKEECRSLVVRQQLLPVPIVAKSKWRKIMNTLLSVILSVVILCAVVAFVKIVIVAIGLALGVLCLGALLSVMNQGPQR